jgi:hypothetical protein
MDIVFRRVPHSRDVLFVEIQQRGYTVKAGTEVEMWDGKVAIRIGLKSVVAAWFARRKVLRDKRREHRLMGMRG